MYYKSMNSHITNAKNVAVNTKNSSAKLDLKGNKKNNTI